MNEINKKIQDILASIDMDSKRSRLDHLKDAVQSIVTQMMYLSGAREKVEMAEGTVTFFSEMELPLPVELYKEYEELLEWEERGYEILSHLLLEMSAVARGDRATLEVLLKELYEQRRDRD